MADSCCGCQQSQTRGLRTRPGECPLTCTLPSSSPAATNSPRRLSSALCAASCRSCPPPAGWRVLAGAAPLLRGPGEPEAAGRGGRLPWPLLGADGLCWAGPGGPAAAVPPCTGSCATGPGSCSERAVSVDSVAAAGTRIAPGSAPATAAAWLCCEGGGCGTGLLRSLLVSAWAALAGGAAPHCACSCACACCFLCARG